MRVVVGLSGGVDSAVAAHLLKEAGNEVIGVTLRTWESGGSRCCEIDAARETAQFLGIPYRVINCAADFRRKVEAPFLESYLHGLTPNPCIICNSQIKWEWMLYAANVFHAEKIATGHYARLNQKSNHIYRIQQAVDIGKDQSYMLYRLTQRHLSATIFPLGNLSKEEVRRISFSAGLPSAMHADSQELCFVPQGKYADYVDAHIPDDALKAGNFVDTQGKVIGQHQGIMYYTVGQRKGLGLALGYPVYVNSILPETNEIVISGKSALMRNEILCDHLCFPGTTGLNKGQSISAIVKIRYHDKGTRARIEGTVNDMARILFDTPVRAPAPGQSAVFYDTDGFIVGGGSIVSSAYQSHIQKPF